MASAAFPSVIAAIVSVATAAVAPVRVSRGRDTSNDPGDVVQVGIQDLEADVDSAGSFQQTMQTFGGAREEVGEVNCLIVAWNGQGDADASCDTAFGYLASIESAVRAAPALGLTAFDYVVAELSAGVVSESQNNAGATTAVTFVITYKIRI
jgi:hypothetical protein